MQITADEVRLSPEAAAIQLSPCQWLGDVWAEVQQWQRRSLPRMYAILTFDAVPIKVATRGDAHEKQIYLAVGVTWEGRRDFLGLWVEAPDASALWSRIVADLRQRGLTDVLIAEVDDWSGAAAALRAAWPRAHVHVGIAHLVRNSLALVGRKDAVLVEWLLKEVYGAQRAAVAQARLDEFAAGPAGRRVPMLVDLWQAHRSVLLAMMAYPPELRQILATPYALDLLYTRLVRLSANRGPFAGDEAAVATLYLALRTFARAAGKPPRTWNWKLVKLQLAQIFPARLPGGRT